MKIIFIYIEETKKCINTCDGYLYMNGNENICYKSWSQIKMQVFQQLIMKIKKCVQINTLKMEKKIS